jgi:hypothetical protein
LDRVENQLRDINEQGYEIYNRSTNIEVKNIQISMSTYAVDAAMGDQITENFNVVIGKDIKVRGLNNLAVGHDFVTSGQDSIILGNKMGFPFLLSDNLGENLNVVDDINKSILIGYNNYVETVATDVIAIGRNIFPAGIIESKIKAFNQRKPVIIGTDIDESKIDFHVNIANVFLKASDGAGAEKIFLGINHEAVGIGYTGNDNVVLDERNKLYVEGGTKTRSLTTNDIYMERTQSFIRFGTDTGNTGKVLVSNPNGMEWQQFTSLFTSNTISDSIAFTDPGKHTFFWSSNTNLVTFHMWGGGGGGGSGAHHFNGAAGGGAGGGGGAYGIITLTRAFMGIVSDSVEITINVGRGGNGGAEQKSEYYDRNGLDGYVINDGTLIPKFGDFPGEPGSNGEHTDIRWSHRGKDFLVIANGGKGGEGGTGSFSNIGITQLETLQPGLEISFGGWTGSVRGAGGAKSTFFQVAAAGGDGGDGGFDALAQIVPGQPTGGGGGGGILPGGARLETNDDDTPVVFGISYDTNALEGYDGGNGGTMPDTTLLSLNPTGLGGLGGLGGSGTLLTEEQGNPGQLNIGYERTTGPGGGGGGGGGGRSGGAGARGEFAGGGGAGGGGGYINSGKGGNGGNGLVIVSFI